MKKIFVDTGAWAALNNKRDRFHSDSVVVNKSLLNEGYFYITTDYVLYETYTLLLYDIGHKRAVELGNEIILLNKKKKIRIVHITDELLTAAWDIFIKYEDKDFSFTDCTSFTVMKNLKTDEAFSFDKHFEQYGFIRHPHKQ
ncbi:MAG: hypothetical protein BWK80_04535 [Desulfobacteraceae bacterium IS3]|nr:MAG: hypothetical protein BWK80_04535 [Desulfobacteraceae bacterium IS3]